MQRWDRLLEQYVDRLVARGVSVADTPLARRERGLIGPPVTGERSAVTKPVRSDGDEG